MKTLLVFLSCLVFILLGMASEPKENSIAQIHSKKDLEILLKKELKVGFSIDEVNAFLDRHHFQYSKFYPSEQPQLKAIVRDVARIGIIETESIRIKLFFDDQITLRPLNLKAYLPDCSFLPGQVLQPDYPNTTGFGGSG